MKILYLSTWDFADEQSDGVCKKIKSQIKVFEKNGFEVDFIYIKKNDLVYKEDGTERVIAHVGSVKKTPAYMKMYRHIKNKQYDWIYNRYGMMDTFYYRVLKRLHHNGARVLIEIPTYPYSGEKQKGIAYRLMYWWDALYLKKMHKVTDRILTYSQDEMIWKIPTIRIMNGIDIAEITPAVKTAKKDDTINLLAVALMQLSHGYERLLYGLKQYYDEGGSRKIVCHFVGDGPEKATYERIVSEEKLDDHVFFYGKKDGKELDEIYNKCDLGICSLGAYKKNVFWSSELKSREYLAKGIPIVSGVETDIFCVVDKQYYLLFSNDASWIDMEKIVNFYDTIYRTDGNVVSDNIRNMAERYLSIEITMKPICDYIQA
ncbi:MAG: glycosyltransferase family 4 protein [Lachnospiraceae bacterium]|nr:glycosyltransferase family 4 protein [Lachnospiraceae bacterium]